MKRVKKYIFPLLAVIFASAFPAVFLYCQNADEAAFSEIAPALLVCLGAGIALFALITVLVRSPQKAALITAVFVLLLANFSFLENALKALFPHLRYWHTLPIVLVVGLHAAWAICRFVKQDWAGDLTFALCLGFGALLVVNAVMAAPEIATRLSFQRQEQQMQQQQQAEPVELRTELPNIYMLIFDEYANFPQLEEYYDYDNEPLKDFLKKNDFSVCYTGHNESIMSTTIQTNLFCLDYLVTNDTPDAEKTVLRKNGELFEVMREQGYAVDILESAGLYGGHMPHETAAASREAVTINGEDLQDLLVKQSALYPLQKNAQASEASPVADRITKIADYLSAPANLPAGGTFTLAYFGMPHQHFQVDENGAPVPVDHWEDWQDKRYYLGQLKYTTKEMLRMAENIIANDPDAVLWLLSDHSARSGASTNEKQMFPLEVMNNPFNAIRVPGGEALEIEGLSLVNTARTLCNRLFGLDYAMLEVPPDSIQNYYWGGGMLDEN